MRKRACPCRLVPSWNPNFEISAYKTKQRNSEFSPIVTGKSSGDGLSQNVKFCERIYNSLCVKTTSIRLIWIWFYKYFFVKSRSHCHCPASAGRRFEAGMSEARLIFLSKSDIYFIHLYTIKMITYTKILSQNTIKTLFRVLAHNQTWIFMTVVCTK
jgi:hypothetical protein